MCACLQYTSNLYNQYDHFISEAVGAVQSCVLTSRALLLTGINWYVKKKEDRVRLYEKGEKTSRWRDVIRAAIFFLNPVLKPLRGNKG